MWFSPVFRCVWHVGRAFLGAWRPGARSFCRDQSYHNIIQKSRHSQKFAIIHVCYIDCILKNTYLNTEFTKYITTQIWINAEKLIFCVEKLKNSLKMWIFLVFRCVRHVGRAFLDPWRPWARSFAGPNRTIISYKNLDISKICKHPCLLHRLHIWKNTYLNAAEFTNPDYCENKKMHIS